MINSMTGYGTADSKLDDTTYSVEIKTVNSRYFKSKIKLPEPMGFVEADIEKLLRAEFGRGMVNYVLQFKSVSPNLLFTIDENALGSLMKRLSGIVSSEDVNFQIDMSSLLELPGIVLPIQPEEETVEKIREFILCITQKAIEQVRQMRAAEGKALAEDLKNNCQAIKAALEQIRTKASATPLEYQDKLKKRIGALLSEEKVEVDEEILAREVAVFAERIDISEELSRMDSHLHQFSNSCAQNGQAGRRLDFISQELLREANTIASKACDADIIHLVVDMKCRIDRIKEQVQNVE